MSNDRSLSSWPASLAGPIWALINPQFLMILRDWSLITGRGGYKMGGGERGVLPLRKGRAEKGLAMLKGGHNKFWGSFYTVA